MKQTEIDLMRNHEKYFNSVGLYFIFFKNGIIVNKVPLSLSNKISKEVNNRNYLIVEDNPLKIDIEYN